jgi:hypothetical protein
MLWSCGKAAASVQASGDSCGKAAASFQASGNSCGKAAASLQPLGDSRGDVDMLRVAAKALVAKYKHSEAQNPARKQPACLGNAGDESCEAKRPVSLAEANARRPISLAEANAKRPMSLAEANSAIDGKTEAEAISSAREVVTWQRATFRNLDDKNVEVKARLAPAAVNTSSTGQTIASTLELAAVFNRQREALRAAVAARRAMGLKNITEAKHIAQELDGKRAEADCLHIITPIDAQMPVRPALEHETALEHATGSPARTKVEVTVFGGFAGSRHAAVEMMKKHEGEDVGRGGKNTSKGSEDPMETVELEGRESHLGLMTAPGMDDSVSGGDATQSIHKGKRTTEVYLSSGFSKKS